MPKHPLPDSCFELPEFVTDQKLRDLYEVIVCNLRDEADRLPHAMGTIQELLLERIAFNYIVLRWRERSTGESAGFEHSKYQKDYNTFWLSMTHEWNAMLRSERQDPDSMKEAERLVAAAFTKAFVGMDSSVADELKERFAQAFEELGK